MQSLAYDVVVDVSQYRRDLGSNPSGPKLTFLATWAVKHYERFSCMPVHYFTTLFLTLIGIPSLGFAVAIRT